MDSDSYSAEIVALRRKLESKTEALLILSQELNKCRTERDHFKLISEQANVKKNPIKTTLPDEDYGSSIGCFSCNSQLKEIKEKNKVLLIQVEDLKRKLYDAQGDIKALRKGMQKDRLRDGCQGSCDKEIREEREATVRRAEEAAERAGRLERDLRDLLDEKEELITERDAYRSKLHRINHQLAVALSLPEGTLDIDSLIMENRYLQERLDQALTEKELSQQALSKYKMSGKLTILEKRSIDEFFLEKLTDLEDPPSDKSVYYYLEGMLDKKRNKGSVRLGTTATSFGMVVTHKQVQELLESGNSWQMPNTEATLADLRSLSLALLEALQDKTLALSHQKKANKILASRITDLECRISKDTSYSISPSRVLLEGYSSSGVDKDVQRIIVQDIDGTNNNCEFIDSNNIGVNSPNQELIVTEPENGECKNENQLPPDLQELVKKAIEELNQGSGVTE